MMTGCKELSMAVCAGRHDIPQATDGAVFGEIPDKYVTNPFALQILARRALWAQIENDREHTICVGEDEDGNEVWGAYAVRLNLYVTGLTVATIAILNACKDLGIADVVLYHYDRNTGKYYTQPVL